ncbi:MAG TPA: hypothetical protein PLG66_15435, partial [Calditrichia bacterium]|nr:hypothetical protein [Calditrichia bacterium]
MRIARINLLFPVWKMSGTVGFSQHRRATLFEKILLDISHNFGNDPHYAGETLYDLLTRIACISECDAFVLPALTQMIDNGIITCQTPFRSLRGVRLEDLHLTEAGVAMAKAGSVAGELSEKAVELYLDPLRREILSEEDQDN